MLEHTANQASTTRMHPVLPDSDFDPQAEIEEAAALIRACTQAEVENSGPTRPEIAEQAIEIVVGLIRELHARKLPWARPDATPAYDGGIEISWHYRDRWKDLIIAPDGQRK